MAAGASSVASVTAPAVAVTVRPAAPMPSTIASKSLAASGPVCSVNGTAARSPVVNPSASASTAASGSGRSGSSVPLHADRDPIATAATRPVRIAFRTRRTYLRGCHPALR